MYVTRLRPLELLRGLEFDRLLEDVKLSRYDIVWIDLQVPQTFGGRTRYTSIMQRIRTLLITAHRHDVQIYVASTRLDAWHTPQLEEIIERCELHVSKHRWCAMNIQANGRSLPSAVTHRIASRPGLVDTPCICSATTEHINDIADAGETTSQRRSQAEEDFVTKVITEAALISGQSYLSETGPKSQADSTSEHDQDSAMNHESVQQSESIDRLPPHVKRIALLAVTLLLSAV